MYGIRSPLLPIVLAYGFGASGALFLPGSSLPLLLSFFVPLFLGLLFSVYARKLPYSQRHVPGLIFLMVWALAGAIGMLMEKRSREAPSLGSEIEKNDSSYCRIRAFSGKRGGFYCYRAELIPEELPFLLKLQPSGDADPPLPGDIVGFVGSLQRIPAPKAPSAFDRRAFYKKQGIHYETSAKRTEFGMVEASGRGMDLMTLALRWRERCYRALREETPLKGEELAVASALWLGRKQGISSELRNDYAHAGGMHVLAVSGLHVGIVHLMLLGFSYPLRRGPNGEKMRALLIVLGLWGYALLTGWSPSVVRAVLMFSLYSLGKGIQRPPSVGNVIAGSALIVLLYDPTMIQDIGFLLSYSAVVSIVTLYPLLERLWRPRWKILAWSWSLLAVSFSAQLGVLPIVLTVFGTFPLWFEVTNPVLLPMATAALYSGFLMGLAAPIPGGMKWIGAGAEKLFMAMNTWVKWVAQWPGSGIQWGPIGILSALLLAAVIGITLLTLYGMLSKGWLVFFLSLLTVHLFWMDQRREEREALMIHAERKPLTLAFRKGEKLLLWPQLPLKEYRKERLLEYWRSKGVVRTSVLPSGNKEGSSAVRVSGWRILYWNSPSGKRLGDEASMDRKAHLILLGAKAPRPRKVPIYIREAPFYLLSPELGHLEDWKTYLSQNEKSFRVLPQEGPYLAPL